MHMKFEVLRDSWNFYHDPVKFSRVNRKVYVPGTKSEGWEHFSKTQLKENWRTCYNFDEP